MSALLKPRAEPRRDFKYVGKRPVRHDGPDKVTGRANYGADFTLPGMIHGVVVRSPFAHARILSIDTREAEAMPGVKAVITGKDIIENRAQVSMGEGSGDMHDVGENCLAHGKTLYHGHVVAAVAAMTLAQAQAAARLIKVQYEKLTPVLDIESAIAPGAPILHDHLRTEGRAAGAPDGPTNIAARAVLERGSLEQGFAAADLVIEREFRTRMVHQGYIEPHACVARYSPDGQVFIWCSTQGPFQVRGACAAVLGMDLGRIKVVPSEIGGGFGGKTTIYLEPLAVALSRKASLPVKMVMTREEVLRATGPTPGSRTRVKMGMKKDGRLTAASVTMHCDSGAFAGLAHRSTAMCCLSAYRIPNFFIESHSVLTNKPKVAAYRAPGAPMAMFPVESLLDEFAQKLGMDPIDLRLLNAMEEGDAAPYGPKYGPIGFRETLLAAKGHPHWSAPLKPNQGRGVAAGFWFNAGLNSSAVVTLDADGSAAVVTGNPDIGGTRAAQAQMVAEELDIPVERVRPSVGDTDSVGYTDVTGGSRVCFATGMAVIQAAEDVRRQLCARAAKIWNVEAEAVTWSEGAAHPPAGSDKKPLTLKELAAQMARTGGPIIGRASLSAPAAGPAFAVNICDLEVDKETGVSRVVRYTAIQDAGKAVHPSYVEGQMQGGAAQGIGWALNEEYRFDAEGKMENASFLDYRMPVASDLPMIDTVIVEVPNPTHPYGVRGVGEVPIVPPLGAVANAMARAIGVRFTELPLSPMRVLEGLNQG
ncbi:MAG TPA: xanthine dehydrogenase family protein molybdopterin-binding subunit [Burkholderiales bacterium]|nr:xanthine dehydrogenase family protein molybdopterin-binding subunit [Burkholderiales bacterium]